MGIYGLDALRRLRERQERGDQMPVHDSSVLDEVPFDAPMDDAVLTVWNGERFVAWEQWLAALPLIRKEMTPSPPSGSTCLFAECGGTKVWLVRDGERWLMFAGFRKAANRRKDFASPFMEHAMRTAEAWYGPPTDGWHTKEKRDGKRNDEDRDQHDESAGALLPDVHGPASAFAGAES